MDYATTEAVESTLTVFRTYFMVIFGTMGAWAFLSIILTLLKIYISKFDENGIVQKIIDLIKYGVLMLIMGSMTMLVALVYNGYGPEMGIINAGIIFVPTIISIVIAVVYKALLENKTLNSVEPNNDKIELDEAAI